MYESSSLTIFYKYLFAPIWGGIILAAFFSPGNNQDQSSFDFRFMLVVFMLSMIWLIIFAVRLRRVIANGSNLVIRSIHGNKKIDYKNIEYISEAALINPRLITLSYLEPDTGESDVILVIPSTTSEMFRFKFLEEHDMTQYIRAQIFIYNPQYSREREPSRWRTFGWIFLTFAVAVLAGSISSWLA